MFVDTDREWQSPMIGTHHFLKEAFCGGCIAFRAQHEVDRIALFIDRTVKKFPLLADFDVRFIDSKGRATQLQMWTDSFINLRCIALDPSVDS